MISSSNHSGVGIRIPNARGAARVRGVARKGPGAVARKRKGGGEGDEEEGLRWVTAARALLDALHRLCVVVFARTQTAW